MTLGHERDPRSRSGARGAGDQNRIRKTTPDEVTLYVGDLYERVTRLAPGAGEPSVEHRYSVLVNGRPVALVTRAAGAPGTTLTFAGPNPY